MQVVTRISDLKAKHSIAVLDTGREQRVRENIRQAVRDDAFEAYLLEVFDGIMAASRAYQQNRIASGVAQNGAPAVGANASSADGQVKSGVHSSGANASNAAGSSDTPVRLGLLGAKLSHSRSPEIHDAWFRRHGMVGSYELLEREPEELATLLPTLREKGYLGINVTIPYKTHIMRHLDEISPEARRIGAVNTILIGDRFLGHNTDYAGFGRLVRSVLPEQAIRKAGVLGTGGSSRAVIAWLEDNGVEQITLVSRDPDDAALKWPGLHAVSYDVFHAEGLDLVVNTTPLGMHPHPDASPLSQAQLAGAGCVIDLIYNPLETRLIRDASALGIPAANGLAMLVAQAVEAQTLWQGIPYDAADTEAILSHMCNRGVAGTGGDE